MVAETKRLFESSLLDHSAMSFRRSLQKSLTSPSDNDLGRLANSLAKSNGGAVDLSWNVLRILVWKASHVWRFGCNAVNPFKKLAIWGISMSKRLMAESRHFLLISGWLRGEFRYSDLMDFTKSDAFVRPVYLLCGKTCSWTFGSEMGRLLEGWSGMVGEERVLVGESGEIGVGCWSELGRVRVRSGGEGEGEVRSGVGGEGGGGFWLNLGVG